MEPVQTGQPQPGAHNPLAVMQPGERVICDVKRHPIGLIGLYFMSGLLIFVLAIILFVVAPQLAPGFKGSSAENISAAGFVIITALVLVFVLIANIVYWGNRWVLTSDSITDISQTSLFNKQASQLSLANLEDVTAEQNGILAHMFNYGTLKAETAGERSRFLFSYCPNPNYHAQEILKAREEFEQRVNEAGGASRTGYYPGGAGGVNVNTQTGNPPQQ